MHTFADEIYVNLATQFLKILRDEWVFNPYTLICANTNAWIHSRHFIDIVDIHTLITYSTFDSMTYYEIGKLAFHMPSDFTFNN